MTNLAVTTTVTAAVALPSNDSFYLNLGNTVTPVGSGTPNSLINTGTLNFGTNAGNSGTVTFGGGTVNGDSGVYDGTVKGSAIEPYLNSGTQDTGNFFAGEPNAAITFTFDSMQEYFGLLWGSVDAYNSLTFTNTVTGASTTITGSQIAAQAKGDQTASGSYYAEFDVTGGFNEVTATSTSKAFEFADVTYAAAPPAAGSPVTVPVVPTNEPLCLLEGTGIATPEGSKPIESLQIGDLVTLADGGSAAVRWMGRHSVATRFADRLRSMPVRIRAGALADHLPACDLLVSPDHALLVDGVLVQAGALVNGVSISRESNMPERFTYYHIELEGHQLVLAENVPVETFVDNVERMSFDNWAEYVALYGAMQPVAEMELPRAKTARQVPGRTVARLAARAGLAETSQAA